MATPPPSQFAALLRRSKFASFDPHIGQVYTAFDGNAARGNFGLKRPLAVRRRNAHITVQAIDSREQQTVWRSAEPENRWIRMWDETGTAPTRIAGSWEARLGALGEIQFRIDSDLVPGEESSESKEQAKEDEGEEDVLPMTEATRNLSAMSPKEFERYLERVRELRPAFREFLNKKYGKDAKNAVADESLMSHATRVAANDFQEFLKHRAYLEYREPRPRYIEQQPHRFAGLNYTRSTPLQTQLNTKPHVGRILGDKAQQGAVVVATAGMTSTLKLKELLDDVPPVTTFRYSEVELNAAPATVAVKPQGLEGVKMATEVRIFSEQSRAKTPNPYRPGSKPYITHGAPSNPNTNNMTTPVKQQANFTESEKDPDRIATALLSTLGNIIKPAEPPTDSTQ
ncbi:hypothetical protein PYCCODRAFT_1429522 [Trametes coccinea BRFM310]|uniref:Uncharacterized protein n=1 Tax=Trametes coccinea (strain BRFM310) TaxID=1353009 RepID=A0A1Y2J6F6_TRAC3|nr:hypothetical protein PYCCODRAFT_1429522 [Trametes coccinea BRFM310]